MWEILPIVTSNRALGDALNLDVQDGLGQIATETLSVELRRQSGQDITFLGEPRVDSEDGTVEFSQLRVEVAPGLYTLTAAVVGDDRQQPRDFKLPVRHCLWGEEAQRGG